MNTSDSPQSDVPQSVGALVVPVVTSCNPPSGPAGTQVTLTGTGFTGANLVRFGAFPASSFSVISDTQIQAVVPAGIGGTVQVVVVTPGGISNDPVFFTYGAVAAPALVSITPTSGPAAGGTTVTLTGSGLTGVTTVRFGATPATSFTVVSATQISAVSPAGTGTVQVTVTSPGGTSNGIPFSYVSAPVVNSVSPSQGPTSGGNAVTLTGSNFTGATAVRFGATPATSFTVVSATEITAVAPVGAAGQVTVTVTSPGGTSAPGVSYFYLNTPALTSVNPQSGPLSGGNTVTLTGTSLAGTTGVTFGATPATSFTAVSATEITAVAPPGAAGPVQVTATTGGGTSNPVFYTYLAAPAVTTLSPDQGPTFGGNTVTLTGTGFTETTAVTFGAAPAAFTVVSDSQLTAVAPPGSAGPVNVSVTTPGGSSPAVTYTRVPPPAI